VRISSETAASALAEKAEWSSRNRSVEADLRSDLAQVLAPYALEVVGLPPQAIRQEGTGRAGRFDSMFGEAIIEYKAPQLLRSRREREQAAGQALGYLDDSTLGARVVIVTDGETWGVLRDIEAQPDAGEQITLDLGTPSLIPPIARFAWREVSEETCQVVLDLLASLRAAPVDSSNLIAFLGPSRAEVLTLLARLASHLGGRKAGDRTDVLFEQWVRSAGIAYGISTVDAPWPRRPPKEQILGQLATVFTGSTYAETIYTLHTYVALAAKLVAAEVLAFQGQQPEWRPSQWAHLERDAFHGRLDRLESGELSEQLRAPGLLASDLFDWYAHDAHESEELTAALRDVVTLLGRLAWARVANAGGMKIDLLRDLYQAIVPRPLRKALGEFFTPRWLAEYVFARTIALWHAAKPNEDRRPRVLDPACGSGTFLVAAVRHGLHALDQEELGEDDSALRELADAVIGFDINPVSALMARVNLLLALGDRIAAMPEIAFHVYQADSIVLPRVVSGQMELGDVAQDVLIVPTAIADFQIARSLMTSRRIEVLRHNLETALRAELSSELFLSAFAGEIRATEPISDENDSSFALANARDLFEQLRQLRAEDRDDVWARVLEQAVAPLLLEAVDVVVGNPPWVSWKNLPEAWKNRSEPIWRSWGLWRTRARGSGVPLSDISTLMFARSIATYGREGVIGMLLPQSVQLADPSGRAFRRCYLRPEEEDTAQISEPTDIHYEVIAADDFTRIHPFSPDAANLTIALYVRPGAQPAFPVPMTRWARRPRARIKAEWGWSRAAVALESEVTAVEPVDSSDSASPWGFSAPSGALPLRSSIDSAAAYVFGRGYETRGLDGLFTFSVLTPAPTGDRRHIRVRNIPDAGDNTRGEEPREGVVEADLLWPLVKGEDVTKWLVHSTDRYWFVPYEPGEANPDITIDSVASRFPRFFQYVQPWISRYASRSLYQRDAPEDFPWSLSGPIEHLRPDGALLLVRYIGAPVAAVATPTYDPRLERTTLPIPNNKSNIYYAESSDEAHYMAAFINSGPAQGALSRFAVSTGVTPVALARLPLPRFNASNPEHRALADIGRRASEVAATADLEELEVIERAAADLVTGLVAS
jgi:hypothetical protein